MKYKKYKKRFVRIILNYLVEDQASWKILGQFILNRPKSSDWSKKTSISFSKEKKMGLESHLRAWVKSIVWRMLGIIVLGVVSWLVTHSWKDVTAITIIFHGVRVILYYFHERVWDRISWGRIRHPLSSLPVNKELKPEDLRLIQNQLRELGYLD